jgi:hypothetical protein
LRKIIKWPILQLDSFLAAATNQLVHCRHETGASAGERAGPEAVDPPAWFRSPTAF